MNRTCARSGSLVQDHGELRKFAEAFPVSNETGNARPSVFFSFLVERGSAAAYVGVPGVRRRRQATGTYGWQPHDGHG